MIQSIRRETIALGLLNSLETERYVRGPLLVEVIDAIAHDERFSAAVRSAHALLERVERRVISDAEFARGIAELRAMISNPRASTERLAQTSASAA